MTYEYMRKSYQKLLEEALEDESKAGDIYRYMADVSPNTESAITLRALAADEDSHHNMITHLLTIASVSYDVITQAERKMGILPSGKRRFPQTYGEWVDIAEELKTKYSDDFVGVATVNFNLSIIAQEGEVTPVVSESDVDDAKRWLIQKAGELGIS